MSERSRAAGPASPAGPAGPDLTRGVAAIRAALGLGPEEARRIQRAGRRLGGHVDGWVDSFYNRLLTDPKAMTLLDDDARVIRLKRSLRAWFHELFSLSYDESYARARQTIGTTHLRINMPPYLMVTAMGGLRRDVCASVRRVYAEEPEVGAATENALLLALDMELALMLSAYHREERALGRRQDREVYAERFARRFSRLLLDRVSAAACYAELAARDPERRAEWTQKLQDVLLALARFDHRARIQANPQSLPRRRIGVSHVCARALERVQWGVHTTFSLSVEPPDLLADVHAEALELAVEELAQNAALHAPGSVIRVHVSRAPEGRLLLEVTDQGPGWATGVTSVRDLYALGTGLGLSFCEIVADLHGGSIELFRPPDGGAGVRLSVGDGLAPGSER